MTPERHTQDRVVDLLTTQLPYRKLGNWQYRPGNDNIDESLLKSYLLGRGYPKVLVTRAITQLRATANEPG